MSTSASWQDKGTLSSQGFHADQTAHKCTSAEQLTVIDKSGQIEMETDGTFHKEMNARKLFMTRRGSFKKHYFTLISQERIKNPAVDE